MNNYREVLKLVEQRLASLEPAEVARKANVIYMDREQCFLVPFLACLYRVSWPQGQVFRIGMDPGPAETTGAMVVLHYLITADGSPLQGKWITYRELWGGIAFYPAFKKRSIDLLTKSFVQTPEKLCTGVEVLGGSLLGTYNWQIPVLPCIPMACTLWPGDEDVPGQGNLLFDASANSYLHTEDLAVLGELLVSCLVHGPGRQAFKGTENIS